MFKHLRTETARSWRVQQLVVKYHAVEIWWFRQWWPVTLEVAALRSNLYNVDYLWKEETGELHSAIVALANYYFAIQLLIFNRIEWMFICNFAYCNGFGESFYLITRIREILWNSIISFSATLVVRSLLK